MDDKPLSELEKALLAQSLVHPDGSVSSPTCCGQTMTMVGDCGMGCCDDYKCGTCGKKLRVEWPD